MGLQKQIAYKNRVYRGLKAYARAWVADHPKATKEEFIKELGRFDVNYSVASAYFYEIFKAKTKLKREKWLKHKRTQELIPTVNIYTENLFICSNCHNFEECSHEKYNLTFINKNVKCSVDCKLFGILKENI